ncbi:hypothetical protein Prudu_006940 [Prunus dulcis]|uniref:Uncharacterized protein n=1 Tax=Prunus dulcis TaxID=3755 RepID=A0A4Y1R0W1_PRUDU|nr:hypothetical protein Prudu_006940 [Prunus dulcis]
MVRAGGRAIEVRGIHHRASHSFRTTKCRTRTGLGSNSKVEIGSGPVNLPRGAGIWPENHDFRRWFVRMPPELPAQISPPFLHQIDRAPGARQDFKRRPLRIEGDLPNFRQKSKEI